MTAVEKLLATARAEIGYLEKATNAGAVSPVTVVPQRFLSFFWLHCRKL